MSIAPVSAGQISDRPFWRAPTASLLTALGASRADLTQRDADARLKRFGPNRFDAVQSRPLLTKIATRLLNPLVTIAVAGLTRLGVDLKIISGDQLGVVQHVAATVGLPSDSVLTGTDIASLTDSGLAAQAKGISLFARVDPEQKKRVIEALRQRGHIVGFLGDGVNDAPAIHAAHVGLSVEGATEVARAAADMILLAADLSVLADGVREGRRTLPNILKYARMGTSSNFSNMLSMAIASVVLPFLPLLPLQILLNDLLYDLSEIGISLMT